MHLDAAMQQCKHNASIRGVGIAESRGRAMIVSQGGSERKERYTMSTMCGFAAAVLLTPTSRLRASASAIDVQSMRLPAARRRARRRRRGSSCKIDVNGVIPCIMLAL